MRVVPSIPDYTAPSYSNSAAPVKLSEFFNFSGSGRTMHIIALKGRVTGAQCENCPSVDHGTKPAIVIIL